LGDQLGAQRGEIVFCYSNSCTMGRGSAWVCYHREKKGGEGRREDGADARPVTVGGR